MQPYEIRQLGDGSIDYDNYHARPITLLTPAVRRLGRKAALAMVLVVVIAAAAITVA